MDPLPSIPRGRATKAAASRIIGGPNNEVHQQMREDAWRDYRPNVSEMTAEDRDFLGITAAAPPANDLYTPENFPRGFELDYQEWDARGRLIAPTGAPSKLTPDDYAEVRSPEFKQWVGDWMEDPRKARVLMDDLTGEPLVVHRGESSGAEYDVFEMHKTRAQSGFFFATDRTQAEWYARGDPVRSFYLKSENPLDLRSIDYTDHKLMQFLRDYEERHDEWICRESGETTSAVDHIERGDLYHYEGSGRGDRWHDLFVAARSAGYDSVVVRDMTDGTVEPVVVVFDNEQIRRVASQKGPAASLPLPGLEHDGPQRSVALTH